MCTMSRNYPLIARKSLKNKTLGLSTKPSSTSHSALYGSSFFLVSEGFSNSELLKLSMTPGLQVVTRPTTSNPSRKTCFYNFLSNFSHHYLSIICTFIPNQIERIKGYYIDGVIVRDNYMQ